MKIQKLTDNKIRIILNIDDLARKNIDVNSLIKDNDMSQKLFKKILKQAEKEVGFETQNSKLLIEAFVSSDGYFILTFTKINNDVRSQIVSTPKVKRKSPNICESVAIYQFESFDEFCNFCTYLYNSDLWNLRLFAKKISLYEYNTKYFLVFSKIDKDFDKAPLLFTILSEFAKLSSNSPCFESKLVEFGKVVFKNNAIENGINYFADA